MCWAEEIQSVDNFIGFTVEGQYFEFDQRYHIVGNYHEIRDEMLALMVNAIPTPVDYGIFMSNHQDYDCFKQSPQYTVPGYFFIDSPNEIESFTVWFDGETQNALLNFNQINCN